MKKIGVFLAFAPEQSLKNQGIGRLLAFILKSLSNQGELEVVIACPAWYKPYIKELFNDNNLSLNKIKLITTNCVPVPFKLKRFLFSLSRKKNNQEKSNKKEKGSVFKKKLAQLLGFLMSYWLTFFIFVIVSSLLFPFFLIGAIPFLFLKKLRLYSHCYRLYIALKQIFNMPLSYFKHSEFAQTAYLQLRKIELEKLVKKINRKKDISIWFVPTLFWPEIEKIKVKKIVAFPDMVFFDYPTHFLVYPYDNIYNTIAKTVSVADHFICYSENVKQSHLQKGFNVSAEAISVIAHGTNELGDYLAKKESPEPKMDDIHETAIEIVKNFQQKHLRDNHYLFNYDFSSMRYIFYSSQVRPYKNILALVKATEVLLRKRFLNVKLILTCDFSESPKLRNYIIENRLQYDVLSLHNVPSKVLAALNHLAICAVNPTLFEGGFPFTFSEAYSVGTPSIMSDIPVTREVITDENLRTAMLFDPYNLDDMIDKIAWGIENRDKLYEMQKPLYDKLKERTWDKVASEYIQVFEDVASNGSK